MRAAPVAASTSSTKAPIWAALSSARSIPPIALIGYGLVCVVSEGRREDAVALVGEQRCKRGPVVESIAGSAVDEHHGVRVFRGRLAQPVVGSCAGYDSRALAAAGDIPTVTTDATSVSAAAIAVRHLRGCCVTVMASAPSSCPVRREQYGSGGFWELIRRIHSP